MPDSPPNARLIQLAGWVAILGSLMGATGDILLLYAPGGGYEVGDYAFLEGISRSRTLWGHYLGVLGIPLQAAGIYLIYLGLKPIGIWTARIVSLIGVYFLFPGVAYHGSVFPFSEAVRSGQDFAPYQAYSEPLAAAFVVAFFLLMLGLTVLILMRKTKFPAITAMFSPAVTYLLWIGLYVAVPAVGTILLPAGFNLGMGIFFAALLYRRKVLA